jgi:hypothetical protein
LNEFKDGEFPPVKKLEELVPEKCPDLSMGERDIFFYAGQRALVRTLWQVYNEQNEVQ